MGIDAVSRQVCLLALVLHAGSCGRAPDPALDTVEEPPRLAAAVNVADPRSASQLVSGWHQIEQSSWRWTARNFSAVLRPPPAAAKHGAILRLELTVPEIVISELKEVTLTASIGGRHLAPVTFRQPGSSTYQRDVAAALLVGDSVRIDFALDKAIPSGKIDLRELGIVVKRLSLETK